jgi:hypothetical protein
VTREPLTETTRELACLALGHDDSGAPRCPESDEHLVADLVHEVQALRLLAGVVEESSIDRAERLTAAVHALDSADERAWLGTEQRAEALLDRFAASGWTLHPVRRP